MSSSIDLLSSTPRATSFKSQKHQRVSEWVIYWQGQAIIELGSDENKISISMPWDWKLFQWKSEKFQFHVIEYHCGSIQSNFKKSPLGSYLMSCKAASYILLKWEKDFRAIGTTLNYTVFDMTLMLCLSCSLHLCLLIFESIVGFCCKIDIYTDIQCKKLIFFWVFYVYLVKWVMLCEYSLNLKTVNSCFRTFSIPTK